MMNRWTTWQHSLTVKLSFRRKVLQQCCSWSTSSRTSY